MKHKHIVALAHAIQGLRPTEHKQSASQRAFSFLPSLREATQADTHIDQHTCTQKTEFHESLYDKGKEAQRRKQAWADKQKQVTREAHACSLQRILSHLSCTTAHRTRIIQRL